MSFPIKFIYNNEPMNKISKNVDNEIMTLTGTLRDESSIVDPVVLVECPDPITANYAYIEAFRRYYFIKDISAFRSYQDENQNMHNLWRITMHTDVLKTFSKGILGSPCVVAKSTNRFNLYLNDSNYKCYAYEYVSTQRFPGGFDTEHPSYVLTLLGNKTQTPPSE